MTLKFHLATALVAASAAALATPAIAASTDEDSREISSYVLTEAGLAKFTQATRKLSAVPGACAEEDDDSDAQSIDQMVTKLDAVPGARSAIQSAGMTTREYVVFMWSMLQNSMAAWAASQPGGKLPPGVSQANVDFARKHEADMQAIEANDPCDDDTEDEEEAEA
jgi:hypothetical protein